MCDFRSPPTLSFSQSQPFSLAKRQCVTLLIYGRSEVSAAQLEEGGRLAIGRGAPLEHPALSARHLSVELRDGTVWAEDLGSTNGTTLDGEALHDRRAVEPGAELVLGQAVLISVHRPSAAGELPPRGALRHERFVAAVEKEASRQRVLDRPLGLVLVRSIGERGQLDRWCARVQRDLRSVDELAVYDQSTLELLIPEADEAALQKLARDIVGGRVAGEPALRCGLGLLPESATTTEALLEVTREALLATTAERPVCVATPITERSLPPPPADPCGPLVQSEAMRRVYAAADRLAAATIPVLIVGETGTGKELVARAIHQRGPRGDQPLRCLNCAAIPGSLLESALFGHERGAFTGADRAVKGVFEQAAGGTVLLDEIGELPAAAQAALLRVLETNKICRVGAEAEINIDVRIVAATHRDLEAMCEAERFRWDLLYRLNTMTLRLPPLRERLEEIAELAHVFLRQANVANGRAVRSLEPAVLERLCAHDWPGNVRELRNVIDRAVVMAEGDRIALADLPEPLQAPPSAPTTTTATDPASFFDWDALANAGISYKERVRRCEDALLRWALERCEHNQTRVAALLEIPIRTLAYKIRAFGITVSGR